jgi:arginyl-tRNA synthetase
MTSLTHHLSTIVGDAFDAQGLDRALGRVTVSDRPDLAQFQCNGALAAAKAAKKNPREVAQGIVDALQKSSIFSKIDIAGPGFINLTLTDEALADFISTHHNDGPDIGKNTPVVIDYGGPNVAKAMHVGHLRAAIIGDSVRRTLKYAGYQTYGDVHLGDWGTNIGMLIGHYVDHGETDLVMKVDLNNAEDVARLVDDMAERYPRSAAEAKENPDKMDRARAAAVQLQNKEEPYYSIWEKVRAISIADIQKNYDALGVTFDLWKGEADVHDLIAPMVEDLKAKGHAIESDGAWVVPVTSNEDKKEYPPLILYKRDGAVMYGTTDLATIVERIQLYQPAKIVYVVDQRQSLHFEQVFRAARLGGIAPDNVELTHAGFGTMNGTDGKPFKTRAGGVMRLEELIAMAREKAVARMDEAHIGENMDEAERADVAHKVAIAAIKFADLQNARQADYVFDLDRLTRFEGKTGPYLLYQAVRIKSLLRKAGDDTADAPLVIQDADRDLVLTLTQMQDAIELALSHYAPHFLCDYAYRLAQAFSSFYGNCHILSEEDAALRASRLRLCAMTYQTLDTVLGLLGMTIPDRM